MKNSCLEFLVLKTEDASKTLLQNIKDLKNLSDDFSRNWLENNQSSAVTTSEKAFHVIEYIQGEILRHRDDLRGRSSSKLRIALNLIVGDILDPANLDHKKFFQLLPTGEGKFPPNVFTKPLNLEKALNKLKHRGASAVNFTTSKKHILYIFTNGDNHHKDSISKLNLYEFCNACEAAAKAIQIET